MEVIVNLSYKASRYNRDHTTNEREIYQMKKERKKGTNICYKCMVSAYIHYHSFHHFQRWFGGGVNNLSSCCTLDHIKNEITVPCDGENAWTGTLSFHRQRWRVLQTLYFYLYVCVYLFHIRTQPIERILIKLGVHVRS